MIESNQHAPNHPRLRRANASLAELLGLSDPTEYAAAIDEVQTLLIRCGYHVRAARDQRRWQAQRVAVTRQDRLAPTKRRRGRPVGSANWAQRQLALGLATIWADHGGKRPTRRFDAIGERGAYGPYREFVIAVLDMVPRALRITRKGGIPDVEWLVRDGINAYHETMASSDEARRRGLLAASDWQRDP